MRWLCVVLTCCLVTDSFVAFANVYDCWDPEKLQRMKFDTQQNAPDPGLAQFSKMVRCLSQQSGKASGQPGSGQDWNQWSNFVGGQFFPNWNNKNNPNAPNNPNNNPNIPNNMHNPNIPNNMNNPNMPNNMNNPNWPPPQRQDPNDWRNRNQQQPKPGVHPDDWGRDRDWRSRQQNMPDSVPGGPAMGPPPQGPQPGPNAPDWNSKDARKRERENRKREREERRRKEQEMMNTNNNLIEGVPPAWGGEPSPIDSGPSSIGSGPLVNDFNPLMTAEETTAVTVSRKYGYAIMALAVVVLAVLMVATIFCCNSSNSTMSQSANQQLAPVNQYDTYSIYSYKGGAVADTLRSTGTLGGMSMHTETMKSRGSPQYRMSDIDPDFARRYKETQQY